jgi:hypothetical protein
MSASKTFQPRKDDPPNLTIVSEDKVFYAVQKQKLLERSTNRFGDLLASDDMDTLHGW